MKVLKKCPDPTHQTVKKCQCCPLPCYSLHNGSLCTVLPSTKCYPARSVAVVKAFAFQADGLWFNSASGYKVGRPGHSEYVWVGQYGPGCLKVPFLGP